MVVGQEAHDLRTRGVQRDGLLVAAVLDPQDREAALHRERADDLAGLGGLQGGVIGLGHDIDGEGAQVAAGEAGRGIDRLLHRQAVEGGAGGQQLLHRLGVGLGGGDDLARADLFRALRELELLLVEAADRIVVDRVGHHAFHQHVAQHPLAGGGQAPLGRGVLVELALHRLGRQQALIHHLVQDAVEEIGGNIQRLALADQALGHRLALDVGRPDGGAVHPRDRHIAAFRRALGPAALAAPAERQGARRDQHRHVDGRGAQDGGHAVSLSKWAEGAVPETRPDPGPRDVSRP